MLFSIQTLIAVAVTLGVAVVWTMAIAVTGAIWQRHEIREFMALHPARRERQFAGRTARSCFVWPSVRRRRIYGRKNS